VSGNYKMRISWIRILKIWRRETMIKMRNRNLKMKINVRKIIKWLRKIYLRMRVRKTLIKMKKKGKILA
jgi:hypothetical protein